MQCYLQICLMVCFVTLCEALCSWSFQEWEWGSLKLPWSSIYLSHPPFVLSPVALSNGSPSSSQNMIGLVFLWRLRQGEVGKKKVEYLLFSASSLPQLSPKAHIFSELLCKETCKMLLLWPLLLLAPAGFWPSQFHICKSKYCFYTTPL